MNEPAERRAELLKLARLLGLADVGELGFLADADVPAGELRAYREDLTDRLFDADRARLGRAAEATALLPPKTLAGMAANAVGPLVCARLAGLLEPQRAAAVALHLPAAFLAEVAAELDPRRAAEVIAALPAELAAAVARAMARNGEHVAMGRFVAHLHDDALAACAAALGDADLVRVAFTLEGKERLGALVALLDDARAAGLRANAEAAGLAQELEDLAEHLDAAQRRRLGA